MAYHTRKGRNCRKSRPPTINPHPQKAGQLNFLGTLWRRCNLFTRLKIITCGIANRSSRDKFFFFLSFQQDAKKLQKRVMFLLWQSRHE